MINPDVPLGFSSTMAAIVFFGGMIMIMLGLIGEYIGRIYICLNNSPAKWSIYERPSPVVEGAEQREAEGMLAQGNLIRLATREPKKLDLARFMEPRSNPPSPRGQCRQLKKKLLSIAENLRFVCLP